MSSRIVITVVAATAALAVMGWSVLAQEVTQPTTVPGGDDATIYTCPHHPQIQWPKAEPCPLCQMKLVPKRQAGLSPQPAGDHESMPMEEHAHGAPHAHGDHQQHEAPRDHGSHTSRGGMGCMMGAGCMHCMEMMGTGMHGMNATNGMNGMAMPSMTAGNPAVRTAASPRQATFGRGRIAPRRGGCGR